MELSEIRFRKKIRQYDLYFMTGIGQSTLSKIENGLREAKPYEKFLIAKAIDVDVDDIDWKVPPSTMISLGD